VPWKLCTAANDPAAASTRERRTITRNLRRRWRRGKVSLGSMDCSDLSTRRCSRRFGRTSSADKTAPIYLRTPRLCGWGKRENGFPPFAEALRLGVARSCTYFPSFREGGYWEGSCAPAALSACPANSERVPSLSISLSQEACLLDYFKPNIGPIAWTSQGRDRNERYRQPLRHHCETGHSY
jgi:hypothetical protein